MVRIEARDIVLFRELERFQVLTVPQIKTLVFSAADAVVRRRLRKLERDNYLGSKTILTENGQPKYFFLKPRAYNHLEADYRRRKHPKLLFLLHTLDVISIQILLENKWFADHDQVWLRWCYSERQTAVKNGKRVRLIHDKIQTGGQVLALRPDAAFALEHRVTGARVLYFVERDRGTETRHQLCRKFNAYAEYAKCPDRFKERFRVNHDRFVVLFVTTTHRRIRNVQNWYGHHVGMQRFLLATMNDFEKAPSPCAPIWTREKEVKIGLLSQ